MGSERFTAVRPMLKLLAPKDEKAQGALRPVDPRHPCALVPAQSRILRVAAAGSLASIGMHQTASLQGQEAASRTNKEEHAFSTFSGCICLAVIG